MLTGNNVTEISDMSSLHDIPHAMSYVLEWFMGWDSARERKANVLCTYV